MSLVPMRLKEVAPYVCEDLRREVSHVGAHTGQQRRQGSSEALPDEAPSVVTRQLSLRRYVSEGAVYCARPITVCSQGVARCAL